MNGVPLDESDLARVVAPFGSSRTLPAAAYTSMEVFDIEVAELFSRTWLCIGRADELVAPGQVRAIEVFGEGVLLTRDGGGVLSAFSNVCRHRGHELVPVGKPMDAPLIRCPYHAWSYRLDGELRAAPTLTRSPQFDPADFRRHTWAEG